MDTRRVRGWPPLQPQRGTASQFPNRNPEYTSELRVIQRLV
ncbi:MAG: hypothetical protein ACFFBQ_17495 [Promethearchaeota archaeon]